MPSDPSTAKSTASLLHALLAFTSDYIMIADHAGRPVAFNDAYREIMREALGLEMRPGVIPHKLLPDPDAVAHWDGLHQRVLAGERFTVEVAQPFPDGRLRHFSFSFNPIIEEGIVAGFCEISREVTDRVHAEATLAESERMLRESQEVARVGSYHLDLCGGEWSSSPTLDAIFGIGDDFSRTVESWGQIVHPDCRFAMLAYFRDGVLGNRTPFDREYMIRRVNDGAERWVHGLGRLEYGEDGSLVGMIGTIRDITEQKELEQRLRMQDKLEAIGQLAGGVAHDFNNQLVSILGFADLLRSKLVNEPELRAYAENVIQGARRAADLTDRLLAFSRQGKYQIVPVDLHQIIKEVAVVLDRTLDKRIAVTLDLKAKTAITMGDPSQLESALLNLALNARDAMPHGGEIRFSTRIARLRDGGCDRCPFPVKPGEYIRVAVSDTGVGIDPLLQHRVFEPFYTTRSESGGTGLGLAAVYGTATNHHGCVCVQSQPGQGATFRLCLPLSADLRLPTAAPSAVRFEPLPAIRVLLIDDEASVREAAAAMLRNHGLHVDAFASAVEAIDFYRANRDAVDLVILDMIMPGVGGREAFERLRAINPQVRVVLASGYSLDQEAQELLSSGVSLILQKPFSIDQLLGAVVAALNLSGA